MVDFFEVQRDVLGGDVEEVGDLGLGSPDGVGVGVEFELDVLAAGFVNDDFLVVHTCLTLLN